MLSAALLFFRLLIILAGSLAVYASAEALRAKRTIEGLELQSDGAAIVEYTYYEGTNIVKLRTVTGDDVEIWYPDGLAKLAQPGANFSVKRIDGAAPTCKGEDGQDAPQRNILLRYLMEHEADKNISDYASFLKNLKSIKDTLNKEFGKSPEEARETTIDGVKYKCYMDDRQ